MDCEKNSPHNLIDRENHMTNALLIIQMLVLNLNYQKSVNKGKAFLFWRRRLQKIKKNMSPEEQLIITVIEKDYVITKLLKSEMHISDRFWLCDWLKDWTTEDSFRLINFMLSLSAGHNSSEWSNLGKKC